MAVGSETTAGVGDSVDLDSSGSTGDSLEDGDLSAPAGDASGGAPDVQPAAERSHEDASPVAVGEESSSLACVQDAGALLCSDVDAAGGHSGLYTRSLRLLPGGRLGLSGIRSNGLAGASKDPLACPCRDTVRSIAPSGFTYGEFDMGAGQFTAVGLCPIQVIDNNHVIDECRLRESILKHQPLEIGSFGIPRPPAVSLTLEGTTWRAGVAGGLDDQNSLHALERVNEAESVSYGMPVAVCLFDTNTLIESQCFPDPATGQFALVADNLDSQFRIVVDGVEHEPRASSWGHKPYTFFARLPVEDRLAVRAEAVVPDSNGFGLVVALDIPLAESGTWTAADRPDMELSVIHRLPVGPAPCGDGCWSSAPGCWLEVTLESLGSRAVGSFAGRIGHGSCAAGEVHDVEGTFDVGYTPCP
ncbi:MAG: hypothetical protein AMXMBFR64_57220 [Myxococcales bacterium]